METTMFLLCNGLTQGEEEDKLIGKLDEPLNLHGKKSIFEKIEKGLYPQAQQVYSSGLLRCVETAELIYPHIPRVIVEELEDQGCGAFEGKRRRQIEEDERFQQWALGGRAKAFPGGEDPYRFSARCLRGFQSVVEDVTSEGMDDVAIITHRRVIQTILARYNMPRGGLRDYRLRPGGGCVIVFEDRLSQLRIKKYL